MIYIYNQMNQHECQESAVTKWLFPSPSLRFNTWFEQYQYDESFYWLILLKYNEGFNITHVTITNQTWSKAHSSRLGASCRMCSGNFVGDLLVPAMKRREQNSLICCPKCPVRAFSTAKLSQAYFRFGFSVRWDSLSYFRLSNNKCCHIFVRTISFWVVGLVCFLFFEAFLPVWLLSFKTIVLERMTPSDSQSPESDKIFHMDKRRCESHQSLSSVHRRRKHTLKLP